MNTFYHGDCLFVMNHDIEPESVDLIYLDPPFFTGNNQSGMTNSKIREWNPELMEVSYKDSRKFWSEQGYSDKAPDWLKHLAIDLHKEDFASYLYYMMERLQACKGVLKDTGSIYLHCDWHASHYLKMIMDDIFGYELFRNEIIWKRTHYPKSSQYENRKLSVLTDSILYYATIPCHSVESQNSFSKIRPP